MKPAAHTPKEPGGEWHDLATHLRATAALAKARADKFGAGDLAYLAGLWHDVGKYNPAFQQYLMDAHAGRAATSTPHAVYGALMAVEEAVPWLAPIVYGHHAGLPSRGRLQEAFADPETREAYEQVKVAAVSSGWGSNHLDGQAEPRPRVDLSGEVLLRMIYSTLVDADFLDTEAHFDPERAAQRIPAPGPAALLPVLLEAQDRIMSGATGLVNAVSALLSSRLHITSVLTR